MANTESGVAEYQFDWQNPNSNKTFDFGRTFSRSITIIKVGGVQMLILSIILIGLPIAMVNSWPMFMAGGLQDMIGSDDPSAILSIFTGTSMIVLLIGVVILLIASLWLQPALIRIAYGSLTNKSESIGQGMKHATKFVLPVFGFYILYFLAVMLGMILLIIPGLLIALGWMIASHIIVLEGQGVTDSLSRSWALTKGSKRWLLLLAIVFGVIGAVIGVLISIPIYFVADPNLAMIEGASATYWIFNGIITAISQAIGTVMGVAWTTSAYVELRKIREGVDPESQVDIFN